MGDGFPNFANVKLTIVFIDGWFIFSDFQSFSGFPFVSQSPRYIIDITGPDLLCLGQLGGGGIRKIEVFLTYVWVIGS